MGERDYTWKFVLIALLLAVWAWACYPLSSISQGIDLRGGAELEFTLIDPENPERMITRADLDATIEVLQRRIDLLGVKEVTLEPAPPAHFRVEYPGADPKEVDNIIKTITKAGQLWFRIVQERRPGVPLPQGHRLGQWEKLVPTESDLAEIKAEMEAIDIRNREIRKQNEVEGATQQNTIEYDRIIHWCQIPVEKAKELQKQGKKLTPEQIERTKPFRIICFNDKNRRINGKYLDTKQIYRTTSQGAPAVGFGFDGPRKKKFARMTDDNKGKPMAIILDGVALSAPNIEERIFGSGIIHGGGMDQAEVDRLIITLKSGALPAKPRLESKNFIGPALGRDAINKGFMAIYIASALVVVFMVFYYRGSGIVAVIAILMNLIFIVGSLALLDATLTLPGIAGIILTVGIAVDANILIFERIREERLLEKSVRQAMKSGYARAFWTIFDANLTTALTAFILFKAGTGPIRGFATTLLIGIIASMFTSLFCTKAIFSWLLEHKWVTRFKMLHLIKKPSIAFIKFRHTAMVLSLLLIVAGLFVFFKRGEEKYGIDFTGGTLFRLVFNDYESRGYVEKDLRDNIPLPGIETIEVKSVHLTAGKVADEEHARGRAKSFVIRTRIRPNEPLAERALKEGDPDPGAEIWSKIPEEVRKVLVKKKEQELEPAERENKKYVAADFTAGDLITATALHLFEKKLALAGWPGPNEVADKEDYIEQEYNAKRRGRTILRVNLLRPEASPDKIVSYYKARLEEIEGGSLEELLVIDVSETGYADEETRKLFIQLQVEAKSSQTAERGALSGQDLLRAVKRVFNTADYHYGAVSENMPESTNVAPRAAHNLRSKAFLALLLAGIAILIYITFRFEFRFALGAIAALVHDVLIAMGIISFVDQTGLVDIKISLPTIAAFLTIIGYSLNDTIVVFDRIRENLGKQVREKKLKNFGEFADLVNRSVNETLSRTVWTSLTTLLVVLVLFMSGVQTIQGFSFTLMIGVVVGTYSSIFIAVPVLLMFEQRDAGAAETVVAPSAKKAPDSSPAGKPQERQRKKPRKRRGRNKPGRDNNNKD